MDKVTFTDQDIKLIAQKTLYKGFFTMEAYTFKHRLFSGGWSDAITREVFERGDAAVVLPYDPVTDQVVLIEQVRLPALAKSKSPWLLELVAGMIGANEHHLAVAHRELHEETGLVADKMEFIYRILSSPGGSSERYYFYWAQVDASLAQGLHGIDAEHEDIRVQVLPREQAFAAVSQGVIDNAATVLGLQWLQLNYQRLASKNSELHQGESQCEPDC